MLTYMYTGSFATLSVSQTKCGIRLDQFKDVTDNFSCTANARPGGELLFTHLFAVADRYGIPQLNQEMNKSFVLNWYGIEEEKKRSEESTSENFDYTGSTLAEENDPIICAVYQTTPSTEKGLRKVVLTSTKWHMEDNGATSSKVLRTCISECPDLAYDLALAKLHPKRPMCSICGKKSRALVQECACGTVGECSKEECRRAWENDSWCSACGALGTLSYPHDNQS